MDSQEQGLEQSTDLVFLSPWVGVTFYFVCLDLTLYIFTETIC